MCIAIIHPKTEKVSKWLEDNVKPAYWQKVKGGIVIPNEQVEHITTQLHNSGLDNEYSVIISREKEYIVRLSPNATMNIKAFTSEWAKVEAWDSIKDGYTYGWKSLSDFFNNAEVKEV
ncbi:MAG: hypothetical protein WC822_06000 [Candidatus Paceibacterota bacterium]|jgi:hypothetical protein